MTDDVRLPETDLEIEKLFEGEDNDPVYANYGDNLILPASCPY